SLPLPLCSLRSALTSLLFASEDQLYSSAWDVGGVRSPPCWSDDLKIAGKPQPRGQEEVVEHFDLMLCTGTKSALTDQVQVVLQHFAKIRKRIRPAELVPRPALEQTIASDSEIHELCHGTGPFISSRQLGEESPPISVTTLYDVLPKCVAEGP